eukprot:gene11670-68_t
MATDAGRALLARLARPAGVLQRRDNNKWTPLKQAEHGGHVRTAGVLKQLEREERQRLQELAHRQERLRRILAAKAPGAPRRTKLDEGAAAAVAPPKCPGSAEVPWLRRSALAPPKCPGSAEVPWLDRDAAARPMDAMPEEEARRGQDASGQGDQGEEGGCQLKA